MTLKKHRLNHSPITHILNYHTHKTIRWCTPSLDSSVARVKNPYKSDVSISYQSLGFPSEPSGIFKKALDRAAQVYGADHTLFSVNGSTGSNFMVLRALSKQIPNLRILAQRNIHRSVIYACEDYLINLIFVHPRIDSKLQIFIPNTIDEIIQSIQETKPHVLLVTNPTYEGVVLDLKTLIKTVRQRFPELIVFIEESWGSHLKFSDKLPVCAMEAGADICVQSTHKQGGSLQQSAMIHWRDGKINQEIVMDSYRNLATSSPSYTLLASLDAAREMMESRGTELINHIIDVSRTLTQAIEEIPGFDVVSTAELKERNPSVFDRDETKIIVDVSATGLTGYQIAKLLEEKYMIVVEEYNRNTLLLLVPFRATHEHVKKTAQALKEIVALELPKEQLPPEINLKIPQKITRILEVGDVARLLWNQIEKVTLDKAQGRISAENITPYPPGIPTTIKGELLTKEIVNYYQSLRNFPNSHIIVQDKTLDTLLVVK